MSTNANTERILDVNEIVEKNSMSVNLYKPVPIKNWKDGFEGSAVNPDFCTTIIPVTPGKTYSTSDMIEVLGGLSFAAATEFTPIESTYDCDFTDEGDYYGFLTFTVPERVKYLIVSTLKSNWAGSGVFEDAVRALNNGLMIVEGTKLPATYVPYSYSYRLKDIVEIPNLPTKLSEFENDMEFITLEDILPELPPAEDYPEGYVLMVENGTWQVRSISKAK